MDYRGGLKAMYTNPNWLTQATLIGLCGLIPIVGQIVIMGYAFEAAAYLHKTNRDQFPDFNFNRFGSYLARGVGPFLVGLLFLMIHIPVYVIEFLVFNVGGTMLVVALASMDPGNEGLRVGLLVTLGILNMVVTGVVHMIINIYQVALMIRGGLSGELAESFRFSFCPEFAKRAGTETFVAGIFTGYLTFCLVCFAVVPIFWTFGLFYLTAIGIYCLCCSWLVFQLYRTYLGEKGAPFKVKCEIIDQ